MNTRNFSVWNDNNNNCDADDDDDYNDKRK